MPELNNQPVATRHKKACTECRQQKAKCDAYLNPDSPCSRCRKVGSRCVISDPFRREHKRKRLSQLEHEAEELRKRLQSDRGQTTFSSSSGRIYDPTSDTTITPRSLEAESLSTSPSHSVETPAAQPRSVRPAPVVGTVGTVQAQNDGPTQARTLNGLQVTGNEIDDLYRLFFQDYAPFLPVLDPNTSPNAYYEQSTLLFWVVLFVASRSYEKNPTLYPTLADPVLEMILLSMGTNAAPVFKMQSFLLFLTWPPPLEVLFPLSGWLLHLAMQNGLHLPMASHEFARNARSSRIEPSHTNKSVLMMDMQRRSELWAYCIVVYQRACLAKGQPPRALLDLVPDSGQKLCRQLTPILALQIRCLDIVSKCCVSIFTTGVRNTSVEHERSMTALIRAHEQQLDDLVSQLPPNHNTLYPAIARLQIQLFYLYKDLSGPYDMCFTGLTNTACFVIENLKILYDKPSNYTGSPMFIINGLVSACAVLLRLLKSSMGRKIDMDGKAKTALFAGINLLKYMIIDAKDLASKCAVVMMQVWNSSKAFRKADGSEYPTLRIRSRLVMSPVMDMACWWREEYDPDELIQPTVPSLSQRNETATAGMSSNDSNRVRNTYSSNNNDHTTTTANNSDNNNNFNTSNQSNGEEPQLPSGIFFSDLANVGSEFGFISDEFLTDFEWAMGNESSSSLPPAAYQDVAWLSGSTNGSRNAEDNLPPI